MEPDIQRNEMLLAPTMAFKKVQMADKYPKGQSRGRQWKHLRFLLQAADATSLPPDRPNYLNIQSPPSIYPPKRYCDVTGFEAPYVDPRTKLRYADPEVFKQIRNLPDEYVQRYLAVRNAAVVLR
ncbi:chromatin-remodeling complex subunit ies6-like [Lolium rigidum]|uniref:chromatin-remodeling complex subunit ies6-like n=1 Tax=Lolium rigidum TaxID=89674 RepID=UPI001F5C10F9|nr:chromatin-remodeling complex subunit ies6-like [Lolium rigidum]XP_051213227.1 protein EIN6 ENHANCER-like isoform X1 [Lolium perenne]XP_051213228.1 protein EIN6 ENHANCER-like isoform X2 [Lolium perenne]XP_051213229.1 protein EIN6 ENHANCER-like isoform X3 [Lolium perenne]